MSTQALLHIPDGAPFTAPQRQWLNRLLSGLFQQSPEPATQNESLSVRVFFASQGGTAERLAKKALKQIKAAGHTGTVESVEKLIPAALTSVQHAIFFASTYGEGDPPDSAMSFRNALLAEGAPRLDGLHFSVFCLGDRTYEQFCRFGIELDERLLSLGANRVHSRFESDVDVDTPFEAWTTQVITKLGKPAQDSTPVAEPVTVSAPQHVHTRENPFHAALVDRRLLTHASSSKQTVHLGFDLAEGELAYEAGDAGGVLAQNDPALIDGLLAVLPFSPDEKVCVAKAGEVTLRHALLHHLQPTRLVRKTVQAFADKAQCGTLTELLKPDSAAQLDTYMHGRGLIDLLHDYPGVLTSAADLVSILPRLAPRLYSISSSPSAHGRELHFTVAVVRYQSHNRERGGVASTMLADRVAPGARVPIYIQSNKRFRIPADAARPMIMIGPGTGIAPFRAFLHERQTLGHAGRNWLFFGERSAQTDFLYREELQQFTQGGHLRLDTAFSRDQEHKVYVQDRMLQHGAEFFRWLQDGASIYVCGDASRMAKDVDAALHQIVEQHGAMSTDAAQEYVSELNEQHRYHRDVY